METARLGIEQEIRDAAQRADRARAAAAGCGRSAAPGNEAGSSATSSARGGTENCRESGVPSAGSSSPAAPNKIHLLGPGEKGAVFPSPTRVSPSNRRQMREVASGIGTFFSPARRSTARFSARTRAAEFTGIGMSGSDEPVERRTGIGLAGAGPRRRSAEHRYRDG